jgi:hypothetical protein
LIEENERGVIYPGSFIRTVPPVESDQFYEESASFTANYKEEIYYLCQYPGHAAEGMYGKIIIQ